MIVIEYLVDVPYYLPVVASWVFREWCKDDGNLEKVLSRYKRRLSRDRIPLTLVAIKDGTPVGIISLKLDALPSRPDLFPWLGSLYVVPEHRGGGIGRLLVGRAESIAREMGVGMIFVYTDIPGDVFQKEGWIYIGDEPCGEDRSISVYGKNLMAS